MKQISRNETGKFFSYLGGKSLSILALGLLGFATQGSAAELSGCYVPKNGFAESVSTSETEQLGLYKIVLQREGWNELSKTERQEIQRTLVLSGPFRGTITGPGLTLAHVLSSGSRDGVLYTAGDTFSPNGFDCNGQTLIGVETLNPVFGTGAYSGLIVGGSIQVEGSVNGCPDDPGFGQNDFVVVESSGSLCFQ